MFVLVCFHYLDLRFVITKAVDDNPQAHWLEPRWLHKASQRTQVGKLGRGRPIPGLDRLHQDFERHASLDARLAIQTPEEYAVKRTIERADAGEFVLLEREIVADELGQVRCELLFEAPAAEAADVIERVDRLLRLPFVIALSEGQPMPLADAGAAIGRVYEAESFKTCSALDHWGLSWRSHYEALQASAGSVALVSEAPHVVVIETKPTGSEATNWRCDYDEIGCGTLRVVSEPGPSLAALGWRVCARTSHPRATLKASARGVAFGLMWLMGTFLEFVELPSKVEDYEARNSRLIAEQFNSARKRRNTRIGLPKFGGLPCRNVLAAGVAALRARQRMKDNWQEDVLSYRDPAGRGDLSSNKRNGGGIADNAITIFNMSANTFNAPITGSVLNIDSLLINTIQNVGALANAGEADKEQLKDLVTKLHARLKEVAAAQPARADEIEAVALSIDDLVAKAMAARPNKPMLRQVMESASKFAKGVADVMPDAISTVASIVKIVAKIWGL